MEIEESASSPLKKQKPNTTGTELQQKEAQINSPNNFISVNSPTRERTPPIVRSQNKFTSDGQEIRSLLGDDSQDKSSESSESEVEGQEGEGKSIRPKIACRSCFFNNNANSKFCGSCGKSLQVELLLPLVKQDEKADICERFLALASINEHIKNWKTPNVLRIVTNNRSFNVEGVSPLRMITPCDEGKLWILTRNPPHSLYPMTELIIKDISPQLAMLSGRIPNDLQGKKLAELLPVDTFGEEEFRKEIEEFPRLVNDFSGHTVVRGPSIYKHIEGHMIGIVFESIVFTNNKKPIHSFSFARCFWKTDEKEARQWMEKRKIEIVEDSHL